MSVARFHTIIASKNQFSSTSHEIRKLSDPSAHTTRAFKAKDYNENQSTYEELYWEFLQLFFAGNKDETTLSEPRKNYYWREELFSVAVKSFIVEL